MYFNQRIFVVARHVCESIIFSTRKLPWKSKGEKTCRILLLKSTKRHDFATLRRHNLFDLHGRKIGLARKPEYVSNVQRWDFRNDKYSTIFTEYRARCNAAAYFNLKKSFGLPDDVYFVFNVLPRTNPCRAHMWVNGRMSRDVWKSVKKFVNNDTMADEKSSRGRAAYANTGTPRTVSSSFRST